MIQKTDKLYSEMKEAIAFCEQEAGFFIRRMECCYNKALSYWQHVSDELKDYSFTSVAEEIDFFKRIKPLFIAELEYYNMRYQAELVKPSRSPKDLQKFCVNEMHRLARFIGANKEFYEYYKGGGTEKDHEYYLPVEREQARQEPLFSYDRGNESRTTRYSYKVAELLALERYTEDVFQELKKAKAAATESRATLAIL
ncbi:MAG: hypothetical protein JWM28_582 [Chitinophagaceae bacterium]|nr:hypothetical protein [Chitinophagaceae bacterium]